MSTPFESHPDAPDGLVQTLSLYSSETFTPGSAILCRNTAPLVGFAYTLLQRDIPCRILGKDIGKQLIDIVKKMRALSLEDLQAKLQVWHDREYAAALEHDRNPERISDQHQCLLFFLKGLDEESRNVDSLIAKIDLMFTDDRNGGMSSRVTLSTVHKSKGLEFPIVFILDKSKYMPSRYAKSESAMKQEWNLLYVAITRSMDKLFYINSDMWKE